MSFLFKLFLFFGIAFVYFAYSPHLLDFHPKSFTTRQWDKLTGPLEVNNRLNEGERLFEGSISGPESLAVYQGDIYTGTVDGCITKISNNKISCAININKICEKQKKVPCSRPLGLRFDTKGTLYVADAFLGLLQIDLKKGTVTTLLSTEDEIEGKKITFPDDLDIDENGIIYFSDVSTKWSLHNFILIDLEHENSGRVIQYDTNTKKSSVLLNGLHFPNGIQLSKKKDSLLIAECSYDRLLKYYFKGAKKGQLEVLIEVPGYPDNIRPSKNGYWIAINNFKNSSNPSIIDRSRNYPLIKKAAVRYIYSLRKVLNYVTNFWPSLNLKNFEDYLLFEKYMDSSHGLAIEIDEAGKIIQSIHSPDGKNSFFSEILEHNGYLYAGSYFNPFLIKTKQI